jgi:hypothetical protein
MIEHLATAGTLNAPRKHRFSEQFNDDILNMVASLTDDVTKHYRKVTRTSGFGICLQVLLALLCFHSFLFVYTVAIFIVLVSDLGGLSWLRHTGCRSGPPG